jgi:GNAT superfamily N-acetyltransferase
VSATVVSGVVAACAVEIPRLSMVLSAAFADNPVSDWIFDGDQDRHNPAFFSAFLRCAVQHGRVEQSSDGTAVAVWIDRTRPWTVDVLRVLHDDLGAAVAPHGSRWDTFEQAAEATEPTEPHWWLAFLGALPAHQGRGHGGRLLDHAAGWLGDTPAYLEATSRRLAGFYGRHGWHDTQPLVIPAGPVLHRMRFSTAFGPAAVSERVRADGSTPIGERIG